MIGHVPPIICQDRIIKLFKKESYTAYWANSTDQLELQDRVGPLPPMISVGGGSSVTPKNSVSVFRLPVISVFENSGPNFIKKTQDRKIRSRSWSDQNFSE